MRLCERCARVRNTCCVGRDILVTLGDLSRIESVVTARDFYEFRPIVNPEYLIQEDDPNWNMYTILEDGKRRVLKQKENHMCLFLYERGCMLPLFTRPLLCRLHPFLYNEQTLTGISDDCPSELLEAGEDICTSLGMNRTLAEEWRKELYSELLNEYRTKKQNLKKVPAL